MNRRYHPPFSFTWPWPTTEEHEDIVREENSSVERRSKGSGDSRGARDVEKAIGRKVATHGLGLASRHRKRRRRMAPVTRTQIVERQIPTLSVEIPLPNPGDDGESSSSSSSSISSSSSVSVSSLSSLSSSTASTSSSRSSSSMSETSFTSSSSPSTSSSLSSSSSSSSSSTSTSNSSSSSFSSSYTSTTSPPLTASPPSSTLEPSSSIVLSSRSSARVPPPSPISTTTPIVTLTTSRVISTIPLISNTSSTAPLPTPVTTFVLSSSSPPSLIHPPSTSSSTPMPSVLSEDDDNSLARNTGAIIGISIASFAALLGLVFFIFLFARTRRRRNTPYPNERTSSGRMSALRNLLGASPSIGRGTTTSSFGSNTSHSGYDGYTGSTDSNLPEARQVMSTTGGAGISLSSQLSLDRFAEHSNDRLSLSGGVDGKGSMGVEVALAGTDTMMGHATNGVPAALARSGGTSSRISSIGVALTTDEYPAFSSILPSSATSALLAKSGLNRSTSGRSPILYRPTPPQALSPPPSSYHWMAASGQSISTVNPVHNVTRASPNQSNESAMSPSSEANYAVGSSSGHGHGPSSSSDQHSETSSNSAKVKSRGAPSFAVGLMSFGKGKNGNSSDKSSSSDVAGAVADVKRSTSKSKGKEKDADFGFLGRLKSGNGTKRGSSSSFGRPGKDPVRVGTRVSGMSFTTYALDGERGIDNVDEHGTRLRPSSLLNPPNRLSGSGASPVDPSFPYQTVASPPTAYSSSINMHTPSSSQHHYVASAPNHTDHGDASQMKEPASTMDSEPLSYAPRPTSLIASGSSTLPTMRSKRGRSQLYISNDTRWAESVGDSFYGSGSSDDHDHQMPAQAPVQEVTLLNAPDSQQHHSPYSVLSHYSQPSAAPSITGHANTDGATQLSTPLSIDPFARPPQAFTHSHSPSGDRTSYASNGSNGTDSSMNSYNTRPGIPEGLLRPDLRTFVLGLRTQNGGQLLSDVPEDAYINISAIGEPGEEEWRRRESDGASVGSLRDHVDYSRPIGALMNNRMLSTTTFNSDHDS